MKGTRVGNDVGGRLAAQQYWSRKERLLNSIKDGPKLVAAVQSLIADADDSEIPVFSEQLGDYLASRGAPTGWLNNALARRIAGGASALADAIVKARQRDILQANHQKLLHAFQADISLPPLLDPSLVTAEPYGD